VAERVAAIDDFVAAGYEVHVNFSPVIVTDTWLEDWAELLEQLDVGIGTAAKAQLAAEVIFLSHNEQLHDINLGWHPQAEELLWQPDRQEAKRSQTGGWNVRYKSTLKRSYVEQFLAPRRQGPILPGPLRLLTSTNRLPQQRTTPQHPDRSHRTAAHTGVFGPNRPWPGTKVNGNDRRQSPWWPCTDR
jgi:hypothetical protein